MESIKVFVYGTLREKGSNHRLIKPFLLDSRPYTVKGDLYDVCGAYPALVLDQEGGNVIGELCTVQAEALERLDRLEGYFSPGNPSNLYDRVLFEGDDGEIFFVYTWSRLKVNHRKLQRIESGDWIGSSSLAF